jgi:hypothetical protein
MNHTPGPWKIEHCRDYCGYAKCDYHWPGPGLFRQGTGYNEADARLIAAAPDLEKERDELKELNQLLLKELVRTTRWLEINFEPTSQYLRNIHVIKKATGKTWEEIKEEKE